MKSKNKTAKIILTGAFVCFGMFFLQSKPVQALPLYMDVNLFSGYTKVSGLTSSPKLGQFGGGFSLGYFWTDWFFTGISSDYRLINQYSDVDDTIGNYRAKRWNLVSPTLGIKYWILVFKADFQFLGNYTFLNTTSTGSTFSLKSPIGGRASLSAPIWENFYLGIYYELLSFGKTNDSISGVTTLDPKRKFTQFGLSISYIPGTSSYRGF